MEQAAGGGELLAGVEAGGAEVRAAVEDGDGGGPVAHGHDVGVGGVHGEGEPDVQRRRRAEVEGGQADGDDGAEDGSLPGAHGGRLISVRNN